MKLKSWHFGLIAVALVILYLIVFSNREALTNPPGCPTGGQGITSLKAGQKIRLYTKGECDGLKGTFYGTGADFWGMASNDVGECTGTPVAVYECNINSPPSAAAATAARVSRTASTPAASAPASTPAASGCPTGGQGITSLKAGQKIRLYTKGECDGLRGNFFNNGADVWGMATNNVGECTDTPVAVYECNINSPASAAAAAANRASTTAPSPATPMTPATPASTPATTANKCPTTPLGITSVKDLGGGKVRLYTKGECIGMDSTNTWTGNGKNWGMGSDNIGECQNRANGMNYSFCNQNAAASAAAKTASAAPGAAAAKFVCPASAPGITSIKTSAGQRVRLYTQSECTGLKGRWTGNGKVTWGMANDKVGECIGVPNGGNVGFCNRDKPASTAAKNILAPPTAAKPAAKPGAAPAAKPLPSPVSYTGSGTGASLTCNTFPVYYGNFGGGGGNSGTESMMSGFPRKNINTSSGSYNSPAVWNVVQPPSGWNSKYGFMTS